MALDAANTNYADLVGQTIDNIFSANSLDALAESVFMVSLCLQGTVGSSGSGNSKVAAWMEKPTIAGENVAEGGQATVRNYLQVKYQATATKAKALVQVTDESRGLGGLSKDQLLEPMRAGCGRTIDTAILDLASGLSQTVGTTNTAAELDDIVQAERILGEANSHDPFVGVFTPKTIATFKSEILISAAPVFGINENANLLGARANQSNNYVGSLFGLMPVYRSTLVEFSSPDDLNIIITPGRTFGFATSNIMSGFWETPDGAVLQRDAVYGGTYHEIAMWYATAELQDATGVQVIAVS